MESLQDPVLRDEEKQSDEDTMTALYHYSDKRVHGIVHLIGSAASSILPIVSIIVLSTVTDLHMRLVLVCIFTAIFSIVMSFVTKCRRVEVFAAAAACVPWNTPETKY